MFLPQWGRKVFEDHTSYLCFTPPSLRHPTSLQIVTGFSIKSGQGELHREFGVSRCKLLYIEWINNKILFYSTGNYSQYSISCNAKKKKRVVREEGRIQPSLAFREQSSQIQVGAAAVFQPLLSFKINLSFKNWTVRKEITPGTLRILGIGFWHAEWGFSISLGIFVGAIKN